MLLPNGSTHREDMSWTGVAVYCVPSAGIFPWPSIKKTLPIEFFPVGCVKYLSCVKDSIWNHSVEGDSWSLTMRL